MNKASTWLRLPAIALVVGLVASGCGDSSGNSPTVPSPVSMTPGGAPVTITITPTGLDPRTVTVAVGQSVAFVNGDSVVHDIASDPHPAHDACPPINRVGNLAPGARMETNALTIARTCGFHDLLRDGDARWHGTIVVQ